MACDNEVRSIAAKVLFGWKGGMAKVVLDPTYVRAIYFHRELRDQVWHDRLEDITWIREPADFARLPEGIVVSGPTEVNGPQASGDCFCFEDDRGNPYCVCEE